MRDAPRLTEGQDAVVGAVSEGDPVAAAVVVASVNDERVTLSANDGEIAGIRTGDTARLQYVDRFGVYEFDAPVLRCDNGTAVLGISQDEQPVRRRVYVRLEAPIPTACLLLDPSQNVFTALDASVVDISGGGAALAVPAIAPTGATLVCSIALPGTAPVVTIANVLSPDADPRDAAERRHVRVQFTLISDRDRDRLLSFILDALARSRAS
jgi:hypothetical protein